MSPADYKKEPSRRYTAAEPPTSDEDEFSLRSFLQSGDEVYSAYTTLTTLASQSCRLRITKRSQVADTRRQSRRRPMRTSFHFALFYNPVTKSIVRTQH